MMKDVKQQNTNPDSSLTWAPFTAVLLGLLIGALNVLFIQALAHINDVQKVFNQEEPMHLLLAPFVFILLWLVRRNVLYFPTQISELTRDTKPALWSRAMSPVHFFGTLMSHAVGFSLGREGAVVLYSAGLARLLKISWEFWGPVLMSIGFASVLGHAWLAPVFMLDLFRSTGLMQKLLSFIGATTALIVTRYYQVPHLLQLPSEFNDDVGFWSKFLYLFLFAAAMGLVMRSYKHVHHVLKEYFFKTHVVIKVLFVVILMGCFYWPPFRMYQSLGISEFSDITQLNAGYESSFLKLIFTLFSTSVGFLGGEFVPLVFSGVHLGHALFSSFGFDPVLGAGLGAYLLFAAGTRLRWTGYFLIISVVGWSWWFWAYYLLTWTLAFAGERSLYRKSDQYDL